MTREGLGKRLRLPVMEKGMRAFVNPSIGVVLTGSEDRPAGFRVLQVQDDKEEELAGRRIVTVSGLSDEEDAEGSDDAGDDLDDVAGDPAAQQGQSTHPLTDLAH